ncbi:hypothetical protein [Oricola thermophila]|uniref:Uncharacterized protein n=1 Tax=Oricola thermophila TaxID=2742145 RepID=A0A6N1VIR5_9HYPH|nr:hypothetical protein [Oricola thermophila]QKV19252.1 hypothetical protein HTY61_12690 [Oricola thermophila]
MHARAAFLSAALLLTISFLGLAVYTERAEAGKTPVDGYGISVGLVAAAG